MKRLKNRKRGRLLKSNSFFEALIRNWPAKIIAIAAAVLLFLFHRTSTLEERFFSVPLEVIENSKLIPAEDFPQKVGITLRGAEEGVYHILEEDIEAHIDLSQFNKEGEYDVPVEVEKKGSAVNVDPLEIRVEPLMINVELEKKVTKTLEVIPKFEGFPAHGYELEQYFITPTFVKVEGPESRVENLETVNTEKIDLTGKKDDFTVRVQIDHSDSLVRFPGGDVVEFHAIIQEAIILKTFEPVDIVRIDLSPDLVVVDGENTGSIKLQGSQLLIEKVGREQVRLVVDCSLINSPGTYTLPTRPDVPLGLLVLNYDPVEITLTVRPFEETEQ
jgi:hypothetical protein